jgi:hypothetical protein
MRGSAVAMISEPLQNVFVKRQDRGLLAVMVTTDRAAYGLDGDGFFRVADGQALGDPALPAAFRGRRVVEVRCDGETAVIRLDNDTYISLGWMLDTRSGEGYLDLLFYESDDVDPEFLTSFQDLERCDERLSE